MRHHIYPAKIIQNQDNSYTVDLIDLVGCTTEGETLSEALENAQEAIGLFLEDLEEEEYPEATIPFNQIKLNKNEFITLIDFDIDEYRKKYDSRAVKKTLTIPNWLNTKAEEKNLNFSQILQSALKKELSIDI